MVKTIFYFCPTEEEYNRLIQDTSEKGGISEKTITFVKDSGSIYLNGRKYGISSLVDYTTKREFNDEKTRVNSSMDNINARISEAVLVDRDMINTVKNDLQEALDSLSDVVDETSSEIQTVSSDLNDFKNTIGLEVEQDIADAITNSQGRTIWTELEETKQDVEAITTKIDEAIDEDGNIKYTSALQSLISTGIANDEAFTELQSRWALADDNEDVLKWIASGFTSQASEGESFASVFTTMVDDVVTEEGSAYSGLTSRIETLENAGYVAHSNFAAEIESALGVTLTALALKSDITEATSELASRISTLEGTTYAGLLTRIQNLENAGFVSSANLVSEVETAIGHQLSELALQANVDEAITNISSRLQSAEDTTDLLYENLALVTTYVNKNSALVNALATFDENLAMLWNYAGFDEAISGLFASGNTDTGDAVEAIITANVKDDQSWITLSADQIFLDADRTLANTIEATDGTVGGWVISSNNLSSEVVESNEPGETPWQKTKTVQIDGSNCTIDMSFDNVQLKSSSEGNIEIDPSGLKSIYKGTSHSSGQATGFRIENGRGVQIYNYILGPALIDSLPEYSSTYEEGIPISLNCNGSGWLGNGGITWDASGKFAIKQIDSLEAVQDHNGTETTTTLENGEFEMSSAVTTYAGVRTESTNVQPDGVRITVNNTAMDDLTNYSFLTYYGFQTNYGNKTGSYGTSINIYGDPTEEHPQPTTIFEVSDEGNVTANSFAKIGGSSNEVLMADGSTMTLAELKAALDAI